MPRLVPITSDNYDSAYYVNFDTMMGYIADKPKEEAEKNTIDATPQPAPVFEDPVTEDRDDLSDFTADVQLFTVEDFNAEEAIKNLKTDRVPSGITQKNLTAGTAGIQQALTGSIDAITTLGVPLMATALTGKKQNDVLGIEGLDSYRPAGALGSAWDLSMKVHANNIAATGEYIKVNGNIVTWNDNTFGFKGMRTYTGTHGGLTAGQLDGIVAAQKRTDIVDGVGIAYSAGQYRADKEDRKQAGAGLTGDVLAIDVIDPRVISGTGKTTVYMKANGVFVDATGRRLQSALLGGAAAKKVEELGLKNFRDSLTSGASSMLGTRRVDDTMRTSFQAKLQTYSSSIKNLGAKYDTSNQFSSDVAGKILDRSSVGISSSSEDLQKYKGGAHPKVLYNVNNVRDDTNSNRGTTSSGYRGSTIRQQQEASDEAMADFYGASSTSNPFSASRKNQPTSQRDFEARARQAGALPAIETAYGGSLQKLAPGGDVNSGANFTGPVGFVGDAPENVPNDKTVADDVLTKLPNEGFVINAPAVEIEGSRDIKNMIVNAIKYARQNDIFVPDMPVAMIDVAISKGEVVIPPELKRIIGEDRLTKINNRGKREVSRRQQEAEVKAAEGGFIKKKLNVGGTVSVADKINKIPTPSSSSSPTPMPEEAQAIRDRFEYENTADHAVSTIVAEVQEAGLPPEFAYALIGNAFGESRFKSRSRQRQRNARAQRQVEDATTEAYLRSKTRGKGYGLFQFDGVVKEGFINYLEEQGVNVDNSRELELAAEDARNQVMFILDDAFGRGKTFGSGNAKDLKEAMLNAKTDRERVELLYRNYFRAEPVIKKNEVEIKKNVDKRTNVLGSLNNFLTGREPPPKVYPKRSKSDPSFDEFLQTLPLDRETPSINVMPTPRPLLRDTPSDKPKGFLEGFLDMFQR